RPLTTAPTVQPTRPKSSSPDHSRCCGGGGAASAIWLVRARELGTQFSGRRGMRAARRVVGPGSVSRFSPRPRAHGIRQQMSCRAWEPNCDVRNRRLDAAAARSRRREVLDEWVFVFGMEMNRCDLLSFIQRLGHGDNDEHYIDNEDEELVCDN
ncbi:unnamed protein product, partial [Urochloa humidicola]